MIKVFYEGHSVLEKLLDDLKFLRTIFGISNNTVPYICKYTVYVNNLGYPKTELTIKNARGNVYTETVQTDDPESVFYINNDTYAGAPISLGTNVLTAKLYNSSGVLKATFETKIECKYILSMLAWIMFSREEIYKELFRVGRLTSIQTSPDDFALGKYKGVITYPFYLEGSLVKKILEGFIRGSASGGTYNGIVQFLEKICEVFSCEYELLDLKKVSLWRLPKRGPNNVPFTKFSTVQLDSYYQPIYGQNNNIVAYRDTNPSRLHYRFAGTRALDTNERQIHLVSYITSLTGLLLKFYGLKRFVQVKIVKNVPGTMRVSTNLPLIIKNIHVNNVAYPVLTTPDNVPVPQAYWSIQDRNVLVLSNNIPVGSYIFKCYIVPKDVVVEGISNIKSILSNILISYYYPDRKTKYAFY